MNPDLVARTLKLQTEVKNSPLTKKDIQLIAANFVAENAKMRGIDTTPEEVVKSAINIMEQEFNVQSESSP